MKTCSKCKIEKNDDNFSPSQFVLAFGICRLCVKKNKAEYRKNNIEKDKEYSIQYYENNKNRILQIQKFYYENNKNDRIQYQKLYIKNNREQFILRKSIYKKNKRKNDPNFKLRESLSLVIRQALKSNNSSKRGNSILNFLPYSIQQLKEHLEKQFEPWMNWNNWGKYIPELWDDNNYTTWTWQLDHIIPQSFLRYTSMEDDNFKKCWALENLRPYSAKQNVVDGNRKLLLVG